MGKNKAIFLDRDGVINKELGRYTTNAKEFEILPDVLETLKILDRKGYLLIVITNQGGIAKGIYGHNELAEMHQKFLDACKAEEISITNIYYSPHHESTGKSLSRKPGSLMLERALGRYNIDPSTSIMIGDSDRDIESAEKVNIPGVKILSNSSLKQILQYLD